MLKLPQQEASSGRLAAQAEALASELARGMGVPTPAVRLLRRHFMATAVLIASRSNCERLHVGCVIVTGGERRNRIVAAGYNGYLPGTPHVSLLRDGHEQGTVHAEQNAVADAARRGSSVEDCVAYVTHFPCINCAKILAAAGIARVKYRLDYNNDPLVARLLADAGVSILKL